VLNSLLSVLLVKDDGGAASMLIDGNRSENFHPKAVSQWRLLSRDVSNSVNTDAELEVLQLWSKLDRRPELDKNRIFQFLVHMLTFVALRDHKGVVTTRYVVDGSHGAVPSYYYCGGIFVPLSYWVWYGKLELTSNPYDELHPARNGISLSDVTTEKGFLHWIEHMSRFLPGGIFRVVKFLFNAARHKYRDKLLSAAFSLTKGCTHSTASCTCSLLFRGRSGSVLNEVQDSVSLYRFERDFHRFACVLAENWSYDAGAYVRRDVPQDIALLRQNVRAPLRTSRLVDLPSVFSPHKDRSVFRSSFSLTMVNVGEEFVPGEAICVVPILGKIPVLSGPSGDYFRFEYTCSVCGAHACSCVD